MLIKLIQLLLILPCIISIRLDIVGIQKELDALVKLDSSNSFNAGAFISQVENFIFNSSSVKQSSRGAGDLEKKESNYIIKLRDDISVEAKKQLSTVLGTLNSHVKADIENIFKGITVKSDLPLPTDLLKQIPFITVVENDHVVKPYQVQSLDFRLWGLDFLDQSSGDANGEYVFDATGENVHIYILDSGVDVDHPELKGRVQNSYFSPQLGSGDDCSGHGTHVAGIAAGTNVGIAKKATVHNIRVIGCDETSLNSDIVLGMDWIVKNHVKPAIINMSLGPNQNDDGTYPRSEAIDSAVQAAVSAGITVVVAAGNDDADACQGSPGGSPGALTVGAIDRSRKKAWFSNFGSCVKIFAPGDRIYSSVPRSGTSLSGYGTKYGTSQATPAVAGMAALYLERNPKASPQDVLSALQGAAVKDSLSDVRQSSNLLLQSISIPAPGSAERNMEYVRLFPLPTASLWDQIMHLDYVMRVVLIVILVVVIVAGISVCLFICHRRRQRQGRPGLRTMNFQMRQSQEASAVSSPRQTNRVV